MTIGEYSEYANTCRVMADEGEESDAYAHALHLARQYGSVEEVKAILRRDLAQADLSPLTRHVYTLALSGKDPSSSLAMN